MVKLLIELLDFLRSCAPLLTSLAVLSIIFILLSKSIKKHPAIYYTLFAIPFLLVILPTLGGLFGFEIASFGRISFLGEIIRDYIHMGTFGHPLLIIIMFIGALNLKQTPVKKLMSIRKELSIIVGFAVFAHSFIRVTSNLPSSIKFFTNNVEYMAETNVASELGAGISSFSFILGVLMLILFIPLWVTSFDKVRKRMGQTNWKKCQKWAYVLYATLFIHAMGIQIGGMLNPRGGSESKPTTVVAQNQTEVSSEHKGEYNKPAGRGRNPNYRNGNKPDSLKATNAPINDVEKKYDGYRNKAEAHNENIHHNSDSLVVEKEPQTQAAKTKRGGWAPSKGFSDITVSTQTKAYINFVSLILIYGSYLILRLRKAKKQKGKRVTK